MESAWDFSALHAELGLISPRDNRLFVVVVLAVVTSVNAVGVELGLGIIGCVCLFSFLLIPEPSKK